MGILDWLIAAYLGKKTHNVVNRPTVSSLKGKFHVIGMEPVGASQWRIFILDRRHGDNTSLRESFHVRRGDTQHSQGGDTFTIFWP